VTPSVHSEFNYSDDVIILHSNHQSFNYIKYLKRQCHPVSFFFMYLTGWTKEMTLLFNFIEKKSDNTQCTIKLLE
jgi:hypothetical protein